LNRQYIPKDSETFTKGIGAFPEVSTPSQRAPRPKARPSKGAASTSF